MAVSTSHECNQKSHKQVISGYVKTKFQHHSQQQGIFEQGPLLRIYNNQDTAKELANGILFIYQSVIQANGSLFARPIANDIYCRAQLSFFIYLKVRCIKYFWASICSGRINKHAKQVGDIIVFLFVIETYRSKSINGLELTFYCQIFELYCGHLGDCCEVLFRSKICS